MEEPQVAPEQAPATAEPAPVTEAPAPETPPAAPAAEPEKTMAEILQTEEPAPAPKLVPEAALINEKKGRKEAERKLRDLEAQIAAGATRSEVSADIDAILDEYGLDDTNRQFFGKLVRSIEAKAEAKAEEKLAATLGPAEAAARQKQIDDAFNAAFKDALERNPEFNGVAKASVIKAMSLLPENANKTFSDILEETYGDAIQGKRTIETGQPPGGPKDPQPIDYDRAKSDSQYFATIMANPTMKAEYNKNLARRNRL